MQAPFQTQKISKISPQPPSWSTWARAESREHACGDGCHYYGFHAFRYAHARFNYAAPELQNQMGHASSATTDHYRRWAERQVADYEPYMPPALTDGKQRENSGKDSGKPILRVVGA